MLISRPGRCLVVALCLTALATPTAPALAALPAANAFAKVPALPTACYSSQDQWQAQSEAAFDAVQADRYKQNDINSALDQKANEAFSADPMAVVARMQQKMMEDPANAQKYMEQMMAQQQQAADQIPAQHEKEEQFKSESQTLMTQYEAALQKAMSAGNARLAAITKRYSALQGTNDVFLRYGDPGEPAWVGPERIAVLRERDQGYAANCAPWWGATGRVQAFLKRYRDFLVNERVPLEKQFDQSKLDNFEALGVPATGWRTTTDYKAVEDYVRMAQSLYEQRETAPRCSAETPCQ